MGFTPVWYTSQTLAGYGACIIDHLVGKRFRCSSRRNGPPIQHSLAVKPQEDTGTNEKNSPRNYGKCHNDIYGPTSRALC